MSKVSVIGAGAWGTTIAILLAERGHEVTLWAHESAGPDKIREYHENQKFLPGFPLPESIEITSDYKAAADSSILFFVVPTQVMRTAAREFSKLIPPQSIIVCGTKGIEEKTLKLPLTILEEEIQTNRLCALSGPNLATEVAKGLPSATVVASRIEELPRIVQSAMMMDRFRVYTNNDVIGVQLGGALKNVIAISAGIAAGLSLGDNANAAMMVRGIAEIARLGVAMGAKIETFSGLSGIGDLMATSFSRLSRNHQVGEQIAKGKKLKDILSKTKKVAEGVFTVIGALELAHKMNVRMPIAEEVYKVLYEDKEPFRAISDLMTRSPKGE